MSFSSPAVLWVLPLALLPLLLHLLSRRRVRVVKFSDLSLLRDIHQRSLPRRRLRELFLIAARTALLACLVLAYAGPLIETADGGSSGSGDGADLVLLIDVSYSMGYESEGLSRLETARRAGRELLRALRGADRAVVGVFSDRLEEPAGAWAWQSPAEALATLNSAKLSSRGTDYAPALKSAVEFLARDTKRRRAVILLGDGARHGLRAPLAVEPGIELIALNGPVAVSNAYLSGVRFLPEETDRPARLSVNLIASGGSDSSSVLDLWSGKNRLSSREVRLKDGSEQAAEIALPPPADPRSPSWSGRLALRPDALSIDDILYYSFSRKHRPRVLCLHGGPDFFKATRPGYFLKKLFRGGKENLLDYDLDFIEWARLSEIRLADFDAVILADVKEPGATASAGLDDYLRKGGGLLILPGTAEISGGYGALETWLPAKLTRAVEPSRKQGLHTADAARWQGFELDRVWVGRRYELALKESAKVLLSGNDAAPLLVVGEKGEAHIALWASSLDVSWSNLALKPVFAAWMGVLLSEISRRVPSDGNAFNLRVGEPLRRVWGSSEAAPARVSLQGPDGRTTELWVKDRRVEYGLTQTPGLYTLTEESGGRSRVYAVNLDRGSESDLTPAHPAPWRGLSADSPVQDLLRILYGRDARPGMLAAAAIFLALEMLLSLPLKHPGQAAAALSALMFLTGPAWAAGQPQGDRFVWTQLRLGPDWDPYPDVPAEALGFLSTVTSVLSVPEKRVISLTDPALFSSPLLVLAGRASPPPLSPEELENLRHYLMAGGMLWIEDSSGVTASGFDRWTRKTLASLLPDGELSVLGSDHVVYRTFFLLRGPAGRVMVKGFLEAIHWGGRLAVIYSRNDLLGAWAKDALGRSLYRCSPGGEPQRHNARKLTLNILMYSLTGSYKSDVVHQPFLMQKMRSGIP